MSAPPARVLVLGGGSAGWMAACLIHRAWAPLGTKVMLVESPSIGIIGVGEGSTPQLKHFFDTLGIAEADWMPRAQATRKVGIDFVGWSTRPGFGRYHHPFPAVLDAETAPPFFYNTRARRTGRDVPAHPDAFFLGSRLAAEGRDPSSAPGTSYGYHFDSHELGALLRDWAVPLGVEHRQAHVVEVERVGDHVAAIGTDAGERLAADLFVDASGFRAALIGDQPFVSYADALFNDRAVTLATPPQSPRPVHTTATALSAGWAWSIPLIHRTGNGYVHSSRFLSSDAAEAELRAHLGVGDDVPARHLSFAVGRRERSWAGNVLAVGLAQGFLEPLEATALHLVLATVETFLKTDGETTARDGFNAAVARRYDGVRDYIVAHYRLAGRRDTVYWQAATGHSRLSSSLKRLMTTWFRGDDLARDIAEQGIADVYNAVSWHCLFAGYGTFPDDEKLRPPGDDVTPADMAKIESALRTVAGTFSQ